MSYDWRTLGSGDLEDWSRLMAASAAVDDSDWWFTPAQLTDILAGIDPDRDTVAVWLGPELVAAGRVSTPVRRADGRVRAVFDATVHPEHRGRGLGGALLARLEARTLEKASRLFPDDEIHPSTDRFAPDADALLTARGYRAERWFVEMLHPLTPETVEPATDGPYPMIDYAPEFDAALRATYETAFAGHWGWAAPSDADWQSRYTGARTFRPGSSTLVLDDAGVRGFVLAFEHHPGRLYVGSVGVRPDARRQGLAAAMMRRCVARAGPSGWSDVTLHVDSENGDGAGRVYQAVGFAETRRHAVYRRG